MSAADRRMEIISILVVSGHVTSRELAQEFGVCVRTIRNDITALSYGYPSTQSREQQGEFLLWTAISHIIIRLHHTSRKNSKKCMTLRREKIKKS